MKARATGENAGYTLIEMMLGVVVLGAILSSLALTSRAASRAYRENQAEHGLEARLHRTLQFMASELTEAGRGLNPEPDNPFGTPAIVYQQCTGHDGVAIEWSGSFELAWQLEEGELDDGVDNNGNGLVDEGVVAWTLDPTLPEARRMVRCHGVRELLAGEEANGLDDNGNGLIDEPGLCFFIEGDVLTVFLTLEETDAEGRLITKTDQVAVRIRN